MVLRVDRLLQRLLADLRVRGGEVGRLEELVHRGATLRVDPEDLVAGNAQQAVHLVHGDELTPLGGDLEGRRDVEGQADRLHGHHQHADGPDVDLIVDKMQ